MLKIAADVDAYAGKNVRNVDLWAEVFDLLQTTDVQANYDPLNGDRRLGTAMMAAQQLVTAQTNAGLDSLGMTTARLRWYLQYSDKTTSLQEDLNLTSHMLTTMQMPPVQILGSTLYKKQQEELQQLVTQAAFLIKPASSPCSRSG